MLPLESQRALAIISHVDHGKSTLADRFLELTGAVDPRDMRAQYLDSMDLERERGITIKAQNVRLTWKDHVLHLIDTPGHVDFSYEVSRSLAACEGVVLLVDASQGIEAQTLANAYLAVEHDLAVVAAVNKIDLPVADPDRVAGEIERVIGIPAEEVLRISAKTGEGVPELLDAIVDRIPAPKGDPDAPLQSLIFDSYYDPYRGVVSAVRVFNGTLVSGARLKYVQADAVRDAEEIGVRLPDPTPGGEPRARGSRLPDRRHQGRRPSARRRDRHHRVAAGGPARGIPGPQADGVLRPLSRRRRRLRRPPRGTREAAAQRLVVHLRAGDVRRARLRLSLRVPRPPAHGDHPGAPRARVRRRPRRHGAERRVPRQPDRRERRGRRQPLGDAASRIRSSRSRSRTSRSRCWRRRSTSARSWTSRNRAGAR